MKSVRLPTGELIPALGQGTWFVGEDRGARSEEIATLQAGIDAGLTLIDTAEMYGEGYAEELIGDAIAGRRDAVFLTSKVYPHNASVSGVAAACDRSLRRLKTDHIDLYLLHWRGNVPLQESVAGFERLKQAGKIRHWGVSNFNLCDMQELGALPAGGAVAANQVLYNLTRRGIEWEMLPWCKASGVPIMAYSPLEQGRLLRHEKFRDLARALSVSPSQLALAWTLRRDNVITVVKAANRRHLKDNAGALDFYLTNDVEVALDALFPPPKGPSPLEML
jgi:diketogulonate reductase-like aldo/keto reductase